MRRSKLTAETAADPEPEPDVPAVVTAPAAAVVAAAVPAGVGVFVAVDPDGVDAQPAARATPSRTSRARAVTRVLDA